VQAAAAPPSQPLRSAAMVWLCLSPTLWFKDSQYISSAVWCVAFYVASPAHPMLSYKADSAKVHTVTHTHLQ